MLPAYLIGMALAPAFQRDHELPHRMRVIAFAVLTPFYFLKAGSLVDAKVLLSGAALIALFLGLKMATKFIGVLPLTRYYRFDNREGIYTTLLMSTRAYLRFDLGALRLTNDIIDQRAVHDPAHAVIASAVVPTVIAQKTRSMGIGRVLCGGLRRAVDRRTVWRARPRAPVRVKHIHRIGTMPSLSMSWRSRSAPGLGVVKSFGP